MDSNRDNNDDFYSDEDGSSIRLVNNFITGDEYRVQCPSIHVTDRFVTECRNRGLHFILPTFASEVNHTISCVFIYQNIPTKESIEALVTSKLQWLVKDYDGTTIYDRIIGIDSESGSHRGELETLQLSYGNRCVIFHRQSGAFETDALRNWFKQEHPWVFVGMELAGDAMDLTSIGIYLHRALCMTHLWTVFLNNGKETVTDNDLIMNVKSFSPDNLATLRTLVVPSIGKKNQNSLPTYGLRRSFTQIFRTEFVKKLTITCSKWEKLPLSLEQIKYCVLDAWTSRMLGYAACLALGISLVPSFSTVRFSGEGAPNPLVLTSTTTSSSSNRRSSDLLDFITFSLRNLPSHYQRVLSLLLNQCQSLMDAVKKEYQVLFKRLQQQNNTSPNIVIVKMASYATRLRYRYPVEFYHVTDYFQRNGKRGTNKVLIASGVTVTVKQVLAIVNIDKFTEGWDMTRLCRSCASLTDINRKIIIMTNNYNDRDLALEVAMTLCKNIILRLHTVHVESPLYPMLTILQTLGLTLPFNILCNLPVQLMLSETVSLENQLSPSQRESFDKHARNQLNGSQQAAVLNALTHTVSAIRGPPGTGKTRTIAALAEINRDLGYRTLITAHANAATLRILQSLYEAGYCNIALVVSREYFLEWHESAYNSHLMPYVVTVGYTKKKDKNNRNTTDTENDDDLNPSSIIHHKSIWDDPMNKGPPEIVILTYGSIIINAGNYRRKWFTEWSARVNEIVQWDSIHRVIVDEASQVWQGYILYLFSRFRSNETVNDDDDDDDGSNVRLTTRNTSRNTASMTFVFVGDENQLPPYGSDSLQSASTSAFDAVLHVSEHVPSVLLDTSYRLPKIVVDLISPAMYKEKLLCHRNTVADENFEEAMDRYIESPYLRGPIVLTKSVLLRSAANAIRTAPDPLLWIHVDGTEEKARHSKSSVNFIEADTVARIGAGIIRALNIRRTDDTLPDHKIIIITPYEGQRVELEETIAKYLVDEFRESNHPLHAAQYWVRSSKLIVNIDAYQGQEAHIVLISLVRTKGIGFLNDNRRVNVLLSRCQQRLFIVGNIHSYLEKVSPTSLLHQLANHCRIQNIVWNPANNLPIEFTATGTTTSSSNSNVYVPNSVVHCIPPLPIQATELIGTLNNPPRPNRTTNNIRPIQNNTSNNTNNNLMLLANVSASTSRSTPTINSLHPASVSTNHPIVRILQRVVPDYNSVDGNNIASALRAEGISINKLTRDITPYLDAAGVEKSGPFFRRKCGSESLIRVVPPVVSSTITTSQTIGSQNSNVFLSSSSSSNGRGDSIIRCLRILVPDRNLVNIGAVANGLRAHGIPINKFKKEVVPYLEAAGIERYDVYYRRYPTEPSSSVSPLVQPSALSMVDVLQSLVPDSTPVNGGTLAVRLRARGIQITSLQNDLKPYLNVANIEPVRTSTIDSCIYYRRKLSSSVSTAINTLRNFASLPPSPLSVSDESSTVHETIADRSMISSDDSSESLSGSDNLSDYISNDDYLSESNSTFSSDSSYSSENEFNLTTFSVLPVTSSVPTTMRTTTTTNSNMIASSSVIPSSSMTSTSTPVNRILTSASNRTTISAALPMSSAYSAGTSTSIAPVVRSPVMVSDLRIVIPDDTFYKADTVAQRLRDLNIPIKNLSTDIAPYLDAAGIEEIHRPESSSDYRRKVGSTSTTTTSPAMIGDRNSTIPSSSHRNIASSSTTSTSFATNVRNARIIELLQEIVPTTNPVPASHIANYLCSHGIKISPFRTNIVPYLDPAGIEEVSFLSTDTFYHRKITPASTEQPDRTNTINFTINTVSSSTSAIVNQIPATSSTIPLNRTITSAVRPLSSDLPTSSTGTPKQIGSGHAMVSALRVVFPDGSLVNAGAVALKLRELNIPIKKLSTDIAPYLDAAGIEEIHRPGSSSDYRRKVGSTSTTTTSPAAINNSSISSSSTSRIISSSAGPLVDSTRIVALLKEIVPTTNPVPASTVASKLRSHGIIISSFRVNIVPYLDPAGIEEVSFLSSDLFYRRKITTGSTTSTTSSSNVGNNSNHHERSIVLSVLPRVLPIGVLVNANALVEALRKNNIDLPRGTIQTFLQPYLADLHLTKVKVKSDPTLYYRRMQ